MNELGLFIEEKQNIPSLCHLARFHGCPNEKICPPAFEDAFKLETSPFGSLKELV
jgi:hypothetical protein